MLESITVGARNVSMEKAKFSHNLVSLEPYQPRDICSMKNSILQNNSKININNSKTTTS